MNKIFKLGIFTLVSLCLVTGCGNKTKENTETNNNNDKQNQSVIEDQIFEGLEFVNLSAKDGVIKTIVINNTGVLYEGSKFSMKVMDSQGNTIVELTDEVKEQMETGTTQTIETKTKADLSKAASIEYSIVQ